jgi:hypothetical protein
MSLHPVSAFYCSHLLQMWNVFDTAFIFVFASYAIARGYGLATGNGILHV